MPQNNKKRSVKRSNRRITKPQRCICNCDSNHNHNNSEAKSPIKASNSETINKHAVRIKKTLNNNNSVEKCLLKKKKKCELKETTKNKLKLTQPSTLKTKNEIEVELQECTVVLPREARKSGKTTKNDSKSNAETRDSHSQRKCRSSTDITDSKIFTKESQVRTRKALNNISLVQKNIKCISKETSNKLKLTQQSNSNKRIVTESSLEHRKSTTPPITHGSPIVILNGIGKTDRFKITRLGSTYEAKAAGFPRKCQNHKSIKHCYVLLQPLPQTMLKQNHAVEKTEIPNKPKPTVKMKTLSSTAVLRKPSTSEQSMSKVDGTAANQPNYLNHNLSINSAVLSDKMKIIEEQIIKKPLVDRTNLNKSSALKLRKRKIMNYAESSLETSRDIRKDVITNTNKIPVYKQHMEDKIEAKKQDDTYEFDSDSEQRKKRKRRKLHNSSSDEYNKTIENILKNVATKIKRKRKNMFPNYKNNNNNHKTKQRKSLIIPTKQENIPSKSIINVTSELKNNEVEKNITSEMAVETYQLEEFLKGNIERQEDSDGNDNDDFDFGYDGAEANKENSPRIKIISDIRLLPNKELTLSVGTPRKFREVRPNAHSTMLNNVLTPWRFNDINIIRNPHFITLKESSLPCINQEMVLDHTMVDKFADSSRSESAKTPRRIANEDQQNHKKMIQSIVTDFFENYTENKENENAQSSLFDNEQFSPIKNKNQFNKVGSVKRRILGELNDNSKKVYASTPKPNATGLQIPEMKNVNNISENSPFNSSMGDSQKQEKPDKDFTNFGFSSSDEENDDQISPTKCRDDKPFRLNVNVNDKKYYVNQKFKKGAKAESVILSDEENEISEHSDAESHSGEGKLFEDITLTRYEDRHLEPQVKKKKKKKLKWMNDSHTDIQKHKRRKDVRSKEEEEEAEKWAAAFNSMCKEIEEFPLEIE